MPPIIAAIVGNEAPVIREFLDYHHGLGFPVFLLQLNATDDGLTNAEVDAWATDHRDDAIIAMVPGEWRDFATNRNLLLDAHAAADHRTWMVMLDVDWRLHADPHRLDAELDRLEQLGNDAAMIRVSRFDNSVTFPRPLATSNRTTGRYRGRRHEYLDTPVQATVRPDVASVTYTPTGHRSRISPSELFLDDAEQLRIEYFSTVADDPNHAARCCFYLAQSYRDAGVVEQAAEWYERRALSPLGYWQERYVAALNAARLHRNDLAAMEQWLATAIQIDPRRREAWIELQGVLTRHGFVRAAYLLAEAMRKDPDPDDALFAETETNDYWSSYNLAYLSALMGAWGVYGMEMSYFMERWPDSGHVAYLRSLAENRPGNAPTETPNLSNP